MHISLVINCHLLTCTWSRDSGWVETHSPSIRLFTFKGKVQMVSVSYQRIRHVWCERICDLDMQRAYLQRERHGFFAKGQLTSISCPEIKCKDKRLSFYYYINLPSQLDRKVRFNLLCLHCDKSTMLGLWYVFSLGISGIYYLTPNHVFFFRIWRQIQTYRTLYLPEIQRSAIF